MNGGGVSNGRNGGVDGSEPDGVVAPLSPAFSPSPSAVSSPQNIPVSPSRANGNAHLDAYDASSSAILGTSPTRTTTGKSGRVIEKLMAENDRLRRELKVETTAREEERKAKEAIRQARDSLQSTNDNLILQNNIDKGSLARKDRKIEELKAERDFEREMRLELDQRSNIQIRESDALVQEIKNQLSREEEKRKLAVNQYDVVREAFKTLDDSYKHRIEKLQSQLAAMHASRQRDHQALQRLEVVVEQQRQELEKLRLAKNRITEKCQEVLDEVDQEMGQIRAMAGNQEQRLGNTIETARETLFELRRLIGVEKAFRPQSGSGEPEST
ncbi:hypothetical protein FN846DRAFT_975714 [Sphaerosporella brunnea]|uniref:SWI5-dependent HO expression protein 3 n=1 Tax=Sphaerosporella brunnea TaxID=1250544 RepID=A0A5J5EFS0_9PEZI|nr:hypothetical protein FN846DRAFT_975714 [Sphaerosporella brunnea]